MMLDYYNLEKMYELERKEREAWAREFWKWMKSPKTECIANQKEVNDN